jgi:hypothetical protein
VRVWLVVAVIGCGSPDVHFVDAPQCTPAIVYLDRDGGSYDHGRIDDPAGNLSVLVDAPRTLAAWPGDATNWADVVACVKDALAPFAVQVTDIDPGATPHYELVFTDAYWVDAAVTHVFPSACKPGNQIELVFGAALATPTRACEVAMSGLAQMAALLGPGQNCVDFTSPANDCDVRAFVDMDMSCVDPATDLPAPCRCDAAQTTQNPYQALNALFRPCPT